MSPEGRERRTKMGFYHLFLEWESARSACPRKSKNLKGVELVVLAAKPLALKVTLL